MEKHNTKKIIPFKELVFENASLIEASAGTGKTYTVSALVLRAVLGIWLNEKQKSIPPMDITKIVLMTFTNAATADLKRKVFEKIHEVKLDFIKSLDDESYKPKDEISLFILEQYKGREADAITLLEQCEYKSSEVQVKTIHGFARSVLASNSLDTNLDQKYELHNDISKLKTTALINEIRKVVFDVKKYSLNELINFDCSKFRNTDKYEEKCDNVESNIKTFIKSIISLIEENGSKNFEVYNRNTINADCFINSGLSSELNRELNDNELSIQQKISKVVDWIVAELKNKDLWLSTYIKDFDFKLKNIFEASTKQIIHYIYLLAFDNLEKIKDINKYITIDDLLIKLESALKNDKTGSLAKSIRNKFPLIIVDEFQDTDDVQLSIFKSIYINNIKANTKGGIRDNRIDHLTDNDKNTISNGDNKEDNTISCFIAVGDPKQSIYMFRGANIYGYQNIRNQINDEIGKLYTLDTNFRSSQKLIYATNLLFNVENNDLFSEQKINFEDVKANNMSSNQKAIYLSDDIDADLNKDSTALKSLFNDLPACHVNFITSPTPDLIEENQKSKSKAWHQDVDSVTKSCVLKIVELLRRGYLISENGGYRKIRLSDIAILVRSINEYKTIYRALIEKGIPSVYLSNKEKIIDTDEYKAILYLMKAVCSPKSRSCIRQLVGSKFFNCDCAEFERILSDDVIEKVISLLSECNDIWHRVGFLKMLNHFLSEGVKLNNDVFINNRANSEIMLTNILHIAEVIQPICDKYGSNLSIENIIQESENLLITNDNVDESENVAESSGLTIRSSSTNNLLKIYTHHKSKGLEYNIVFIPYMIKIMDKNESKDKGPKYIDYYSQSNEEIKKFYEIASFGTKYCKENEQNEQIKIAYDNHRTQAGFEELRLAYVAYTRAKYAMYLWTQNFKEVCKTENPLEKRLCDIEEYKNSEKYYKNDGNNVSFSKIFSFKNFTKLDVEQEWENVPICTEKDLGKEETDLEQYEVKECREKYKSKWKTTSFSSLTINSHNNYTPHTAIQIDEGLIDDETQNGDVESLTDVKKRTYSSLFPKGAEAGTFLHAIFEKISFKNDFIKNFDNLSEKEVLNTRLAKVVKQQIQLTKFDKNYGSAECREGEEYSSLYMLVNWVNDILQTPLVKGEEFSLSDIDDDCVLKEHEFFISLAQGDKLFSCNKLSDLFNEYNRQMLEDNRQAFFLPTDTVTKSDFDFENVQGFLKGYIDLFFMYKNKYYILDYKSNFLGEDYSDYNDDSLRQSIASSCYYLQYSLYTVAMNRFLKQKGGNEYNYSKNMGGAIYLYLRGVDSVTKNGGTYFHLLNEDFINRLDKVLNGEEDE
jgi:exodeoxyribonuclease V beta subunit